MTWNEIYEQAENKEHKGKDGVSSASELNNTCGCYLSSPAGDSATLGTAEHLLQELGKCPLDAPSDVRERFEYTQRAVEYFQEQGYIPYGREVYFECKRPNLTGMVDLVLNKDSNYLLIDYKFGRVPVDSDCGQGAGYCYLIRKNLEDVSRTGFAIIQPRLNKNFEDIFVKYWTEEECKEVVDKFVHNKLTSKICMNADNCSYCVNLGTKSCMETLNLLEAI